MCTVLYCSEVVVGGAVGWNVDLCVMGRAAMRLIDEEHRVVAKG